ncbi:N(4)-(beta-N-acetylglucosaminyl)-L-asparaginase [Fulvivirga ulvae]|uniref:isoaspartyl peptidase/L-asparaginase family protein n=1 Tax=Fulvivirga ulvae TaxID=2904245 RepID=UPI001F2EB555|nr:N(4)-(beta-N-acetylglucosaminyl)-L-asparaginase [Fulvivirga ulvae]UII32700.1 N(4)-(beta-N-acetylglucosaminyl)-L-asparaginase [Fulvivirga ulvae]
MKRRDILKIASLSLPAWGISQSLFGKVLPASRISAKGPVVISTWNHGLMANDEAWKVLEKKGNALDAAEKGVMIVENDPENQTVGIGGFPDRDGIVTLDACVMSKDGCGAVAFLQDIKNPVAVARKVMEETPHVMIVGEGAKQFALAQGFKPENLLTEKTAKDYKEWLKTSEYKPVINIENHDTIGLLAMDHNGDISGACTTSGAAWKMHGRVGDSPIIGAGLFVDNEIGGACATGLGETVIRSAGSAMVVELMRHGYGPAEACKEVVKRIVKNEKDIANIQVGFLALRKDGTYGAYSIHKGFTYAVKTPELSKLLDSPAVNS